MAKRGTVGQQSTLRATRRAVLAGIAATLAPRVRAQERKAMPRLAVVAPGARSEDEMDASAPTYRAFFDELRRRGRIEGNSLDVERHPALSNSADFMPIAQAVAARKPDVIVASRNSLSRHCRRRQVIE